MATKLEKGKSTKAIKNTLTMLYSFHFVDIHPPIFAKGIEKKSKINSIIFSFSTIVNSLDLYPITIAEKTTIATFAVFI